MSEPAQPSNLSPAMTQQDPLFPAPKRGWAPGLRSWIRDLVIALFIAGVVILFFYQPVKVEGTSMMPRLTDQERIFINKFVYRLEAIQRGDVVVFWFPGDPSKSYIKRVIGLPGETVEIRRGQVFVNGRRLEEPYLLPDFRGRQTQPPRRVAPDEFYVLGDHRNSSNDSRIWGTVPRKYIYGKAEVIYWPIGRWGLLE